MASSSTRGDMKGFYKQKKSNSIAKKPTKLSSSAKHSATLGSTVTQSPTLISPPQLSVGDKHDDEKPEEALLRQFDMNMAYGPCIGMSRLARWERANKLGMNPPHDVERLLKLPQARHECLWEGRV